MVNSHNYSEAEKAMEKLYDYWSNKTNSKCIYFADGLGMA